MTHLRKVLFLMFFVSGFCGLLYQVVWVRLAFSHFGVITPVLSIIISVFMLGLAIGSFAAGRAVSTLHMKLGLSAVYFYAMAEGLIGAGAFVVPGLFVLGDTVLLSGGEMNSLRYLVLSALAMTGAILPWCVMMGATFPLMMSFIKEREQASATSFSFLYTANVLGALFGTILTADVLVELWGFQSTLALAGMLNFGIAAASLALGFRSRSGVRDLAERKSRDQSSSVSNRSGRESWVLAVLFATGLTSMALEVVWTRAFTPILTTTIYAFALILAVYLLATWCGSSLYRRHVKSQRVWTVGRLAALLACSAFLPIVLTDPRLNLGTIGVELGIFPFCMFLGYLTPQLVDRYSGGAPRAAGGAYALNIVGCVVGPLLASYVLLPQFGVKNSMLLLALPFLVLLALQAGLLSRVWLVFSGGAAAALLLTSALFAVSHEEKFPGGIVRRDYTATVISATIGGSKNLFVNGYGITVLTTVTKVMAHLPLAFSAEPPESALAICFGMGTTYRSLMSWGIRTVAVELVPSVKEAFSYYHSGTEELLRNPRGRIVIDDGRRFLKRTAETFDVITIDPPPPVEAAGSSLLYSREFYALARTRLKPTGILQQWFPEGEGPEASAITRALVESFPYVKVFRSFRDGGFHFLASGRPLIVPGVEAFRDRLPLEAQKDLLEWETGTALEQLLGRILAGEVDARKLMSSDPRQVVSDDRPYNEYYLLRRMFGKF
jgi:predicted membrane-bound spermidine synthase